jgi:hypothetical protein
MHIVPYQVSMWRVVFQASVAIRSPFWTPSAKSAFEHCRARL